MQQKTKSIYGQCSSWAGVNAGVPQGSILGPLLYLICINDLSDGLKSKCKLFADDTSLFSAVNDINTSASDLNKDFQKIGNWTFNPIYTLFWAFQCVPKGPPFHIIV